MVSPGGRTPAKPRPTSKTGWRAERLLALRGVDIGQPDLKLLLRDQNRERVAIGDPDDAAGEGLGVSTRNDEARRKHDADCICNAT